MKTATKRALSAILCVLMMLAMMPAVFAADTVTLYCAAPSNWTNCNVYWWGGGSYVSWPGAAMTQDANGIWYYEVPSNATNVIFNNGASQTRDLDMPTDEKVQYIVDDNAWVPYGEAPEVHYYVAGSADLCGGYDWVPNKNEMTLDENTGLYTIRLQAPRGSYAYKITTGSWDVSYGNGYYDCTLTLLESSFVDITFNPDTKEIGCTTVGFGADMMKFQLNADASADDETVNLRFITYVESLDYSNIRFYITVAGEQAVYDCPVVYTAINANGNLLTCQDVFGVEGYLVTFTLTDIPAEYYDTEILAGAEFWPNANNTSYEDFYNTTSRSLYLSDWL